MICLHLYTCYLVLLFQDVEGSPLGDYGRHSNFLHLWHKDKLHRALICRPGGSSRRHGTIASGTRQVTKQALKVVQN